MIKVTFSLPFETKYGQEILIRGSIPELQGDYLSGTKQMSYSKGMWSLTILIKSELNFSYSYILKEREELIPEAGSSRKLDIRYKKDHIIYDSWRELSNKAPFLSSAFKKTLYKYNKKIKLSGDL
ncbi:MAG: carbohydrate-binding module family 20 domain-containing protein, partial [Bacteroidales bacterium]